MFHEPYCSFQVGCPENCTCIVLAVSFRWLKAFQVNLHNVSVSEKRHLGNAARTPNNAYHLPVLVTPLTVTPAVTVDSAH